MLSVTYKPFMLSVVMLNVVMLSVVALQTGKTVNLLILGAREDLGKGMGPWLGKVNLICQVAKFKFGNSNYSNWCHCFKLIFFGTGDK
jgi:hypothetical protein